MKNTIMSTALALLALAATFQTAALGQDPVAPQPGAKLFVYSTQKNIDPGERLETVQSGAIVPLRVAIDTKAAFTLEGYDTIPENYDADTLVWEGFLLSKSSGQFTFMAMHSWDSWGGSITLKYSNGKSVYFSKGNQFAVRINGQTVAGNGTQSFNVHLNAGFNSITIMATMWTGETPKFTLSYKPANSTVDPRPITPKSLYHEEEISDEDW